MVLRLPKRHIHQGEVVFHFNTGVMVDGVAPLPVKCFRFQKYFCKDEETTIEMVDKEIEEMEMDVFLRDIYYNHPRSEEIGDYELDFLTWKNK